MSQMEKSNPELKELIIFLKKASKKENVNIWRDVAERLERPRKNWAEVNVSKINRYAENGDVIIVPGKVLGTGLLQKKVTVSAFRFSKSAKEKIESAGGKTITIKELVNLNPKGFRVKIMG